MVFALRPIGYSGQPIAPMTLDPQMTLSQHLLLTFDPIHSWTSIKLDNINYKMYPFPAVAAILFKKFPKMVGSMRTIHFRGKSIEINPL